MKKAIIQVEGLRKKYRIQHQQRDGYATLTELLARKARSFFKGLKPGLKSEVPLPRAPVVVDNSAEEDFWALDDISFDVFQGEVVGIIGNNGAGKSTLLKILSRITDPTAGRIMLNGRVGSLLEVGTGFHPELTGRENIFLNGVIIGMSKVEIRRKFDEIVDFAGVEKFLDTPVKRYSSGMYVRLAFAVAAHLEPEVLVVDEVLAVGDAAFQKKCMGKMSDVAREGRTVICVSHNMTAITTLCGRALWLEKGRLKSDDKAECVVLDYLRQQKSAAQKRLVFTTPTALPRFHSVTLVNDSCDYAGTIEMDVEMIAPLEEQVAIQVEVLNQATMPVIYCCNSLTFGSLIPLAADMLKKVRVRLGPLPLAAGDYFIRLTLVKPWYQTFHVLQEFLGFSVLVSDPGQTGYDFRQLSSIGPVTVPMEINEAAPE